MKNYILLIACCLALLIPSCAQGPVYPESPVAKTASEFQVATQRALDAYATYKAGNANMLWALSEGAWAYQQYLKTAPEVANLVKAWTGAPGDDQGLAAKLARIFGTSPLPPAQKAAIIAKAAQNAAAKP